MSIESSGEGVRYNILAPLSELASIGISVIRSSDHYEAILVLSVLKMRKKQASYVVECIEERVQINTARGFNVVKVHNIGNDTLEAYFHDVPRWRDSDNYASCTRSSHNCHVSFVIAIALRRSRFEKRRVVARIIDRSDEFNPHKSVSLHGAVLDDGETRDVYFVNIETPAVDSNALFEKDGSCSGTHLLREYGFDLAVAECENSGSVLCGIGEVLSKGDINGTGVYNPNTLQHVQLDVDFQWNLCPDNPVQNIAMNLDSRLQIYHNLKDIKSLDQNDEGYERGIARVEPGEHIYADFRVFVHSAENVTLKLHSVVMQDTTSGKRYTLVQNYTAVAFYENILHKKTCWSSRAPYGVCGLAASADNPSLKTRSNGEAFDVIEIIAPKWRDDHTWSLSATAILIQSDTDLSALPDLKMPSESDLESSKARVVQITSLFRIHKPKSFPTTSPSCEECALLAGIAIFVCCCGIATTHCCSAGRRNSSKIHVIPVYCANVSGFLHQENEAASTKASRIAPVSNKRPSKLLSMSPLALCL